MTWSTPWPKIGLCGAPIHDMMADEMQPDDQSFTDLLEVCSQNLDKRTRTTISNGAANPGRGRAPRSNYSSDKSFMFFMQCGRGSIMLSMLLTKAKEWNSCKQKWRRIDTTEDYHVSSLLPGACAPGQTASIGGKRRRLGDA